MSRCGRLRNRAEGIEIEVLQIGIRGDRAFVEADDLGALRGGLAGEGADAVEVVGLVAVAVLELGGGHADFAHGSVRPASILARVGQGAGGPLDWR